MQTLPSVNGRLYELFKMAYECLLRYHLHCMGGFEAVQEAIEGDRRVRRRFEGNVEGSERIEGSIDSRRFDRGFEERLEGSMGSKV